MKALLLLIALCSPAAFARHRRCEESRGYTGIGESEAGVALGSHGGVRPLHRAGNGRGRRRRDSGSHGSACVLSERRCDLSDREHDQDRGARRALPPTRARLGREARRPVHRQRERWRRYRRHSPSDVGWRFADHQSRPRVADGFAQRQLGDQCPDRSRRHGQRQRMARAGRAATHASAAPHAGREGSAGRAGEHRDTARARDDAPGDPRRTRLRQGHDRSLLQDAEHGEVQLHPAAPAGGSDGRHQARQSRRRAQRRRDHLRSGASVSRSP